MKLIFSISVFLFAFVTGIFAQRNADWGATLGVSNYIGDLNPIDLSKSPSPAGGIFYRYNIHPRHSIRASLMGFGIKGEGVDPGTQNEVSFSGFVGEMSGIFEFNFFPYSTDHTGRKLTTTPYLACGIGIAFISTTVTTYTPVIPVLLGYKVNFRKNLGLEVEYGFRKTFYDNFDGLSDPIDPEDSTWTHNNDWYSYAGLTLTWKMFYSVIGCPAYGDQNNKKRMR